MTEAIFRKLRLSGPLSAGDEAALREALHPARTFKDGEDLVSDGEAPGPVRAIISGFACRYKILGDGRRQIMALMVPGDFCDLQIAVLGKMDHAIGALTRCTVAHLPAADVERLLALPGLSRAFWWSSLVDEAILRQWIVGMGQRSADRQMAHLFCELEARRAPVGRGQDGAFESPLSQDELGDVLGLSAVHANRVLQQLREPGLVEFRSGVVRITDLLRLRRFCGFDPGYLHHLASPSPASRPEPV